MKLYKLKIASWIVAGVVFFASTLINYILNYSISEWVFDIVYIVLLSLVVLGIFLPYDSNQTKTQNADTSNSDIESEQVYSNGYNSDNLSTTTVSEQSQPSELHKEKSSCNENQSTKPTNKRHYRNFVIFDTIMRVIVYLLYASTTLNAFWYLQNGENLSLALADMSDTFVPYISSVIIFAEVLRLLLKNYTGQSRKKFKNILQVGKILFGDMTWLAPLGIFNKYALKYSNAVLFYIGVGLTVVALVLVLIERNYKYRRYLYKLAEQCAMPFWNVKQTDTEQHINETDEQADINENDVICDACGSSDENIINENSTGISENSNNISEKSTDNLNKDESN